MNVDNSQVLGTRKIITGARALKPTEILVFNNVQDEVQVNETGLSIHKKEKVLHTIIKRMIDFIGGLFGTLALIPLTIIIFIANKITKDDGPIFFIQERIGKDGKIFKMYKYRSMVVGADEKLKEYLQENKKASEEYRINKKLKDDPRITKVGNFIRKTSIDEFPQFINVLKGEMSLVGPRPYLPREKEDMGTYYNCIVSKKPGITGFWQVNGRSEVNFEDRLEMDMNYYNQSSIGLDVKLLAKTVSAVVKKEGAA